jgi:hypothetical protein
VELRAAVEFAVDVATRSVTRAGTMLAFATADELATGGGLVIARQVS